MSTLTIFMQNGWDPNAHMPPNDPGSLRDDLQEFLDAWKTGPEEVEGADWIIPPARGVASRVVGDDYPFRAHFNQPGGSVLSATADRKPALGGHGELEWLARKLKQGVEAGRMAAEEAGEGDREAEHDVKTKKF